MLNQVIARLGYKVKIQKLNRYDLSLYDAYDSASLKKRLFYNIGAGPFQHPYWTNIDNYSEWYSNNNRQTSSGITHDLLTYNKLPILDNSASLVYSSHTIEHLPDSYCQHLFKEIYRILKPGGLVRFTAPDIDLHYQAYIRKDFHFYYWRKWYNSPDKYRRNALNSSLGKASIGQLFLHRFASSITTIHSDPSPEIINDEKLERIFSQNSYEGALDYLVSLCSLDIQKKYPGNHINWWNVPKLKGFLQLAGFQKTAESRFGQSMVAPLRETEYFDNTHPKISFYLEAKKSS